MASKRESDNSRSIHRIKRMRINWNRIISEEEEANIFQRNSTISKHHYTDWLNLGIGPWREDGSNKDTYGKGKVMYVEKKGDSGSNELYTNWLTLGSCKEDGSSKCIYAMDAEKKGESSSSWSTLKIGSFKDVDSNKEVKGREESIFVGYITEDILEAIFCKLPLHTLFRVQVVCTLWQTIISSSVHFHNLWEQSNMQMWLVMDHYDETTGSSNGLALFDVSRKLRFKKIFNDEWRCSHSQWLLRAGDGGLLVYSCKRNGILRVINPLTMQSHCLEDARVTRKSRISYYMKRYHNDVAVHLKFDSKEKTYQVIVIIGNLYLLRRKKFVVLIYRSAEQGWEVREIALGRRVNGSKTIGHFPSILVQKQKIYCFSENGADVVMCDLNRDNISRLAYIPGRQGVRHQTLGIVMYKGRMIMVCKSKPMELPPYTHTMIFYEFDELGLQWRSGYEAIASPNHLLPRVLCVGGDYIWIIQEIEGYGSHIICIDIDTGELNMWPEVFPSMSNVRNCLSMTLSFCPRS